MPWLAALVPLVVFWHTTSFGFLMDDVVLFQNSASLGDLGSIATGFTTDVGALRKGSQEPLGSFYRPVFLALSTLFYQAVGGGTFAWHLAAVLAAALVAALAALLFLRLGFAPWPSLLAAATFALHPSHVSSVAWVAGLQEQLAALLSLAALHVLLWPRAEEREALALSLATVAFVLALLCKEVALALLPLAAAWALIRRRDDPPQARRFARAAIAFGVVTVVYLGVRIAVLGGLAKPWPDAPPLVRALAAAPLALLTYLRMLLWPFGFSFFRPERPAWGPLEPPVLIAGVLVLALAALAVVAGRRQRELSLPIAWFAVWLLPVLNLWALRPEWMVTDRYLYLPSLALPWALLVLLPRRVASGALAALAVVFGGLSLRYATVFADEPAFYAAAAKADPGSSFVLGERARLLVAEGKPGAAEAALRRAVAIAPREPSLLRALGDLELRRGDLAAAESHYRGVLLTEPYASKPFKQLALALARTGRREAAAALVEESARRWPADGEVQLLRALFLATDGRRAEAEAAFAEARRLRPQDPALAGGLDVALGRLAPMLLPASPQG